MKKQIQHYALILTILLAGLVTNACTSPQQDRTEVRNIILLIGDGMGIAHLNAAMSVSSQPLNLVSFPYSGFSVTFSSDNYVTDSAAGGTAISAGEKTNNGMIGVRPDSSRLLLITEILKEKGFSTGAVSTSAITHATPASFVAHNSGRGNYEDIASDFLSGTLDVFIGGGKNHFALRKDGKDLTTDLKNMGYEVVFTEEEMVNSTSPKLAGLLADEHLPTVTEGRTGLLEKMTAKAIEVLSADEDGFFLMVEGSMIDWGAHANDIEYVVSETIDFDKAVGVALKYARENGNTLVVVTADHETGGLTIPSGDLNEKTIGTNFSTTGHSGVMVPIFSYGPGAEKLSGIHDNTFFFNTFLEALGLQEK